VRNVKTGGTETSRGAAAVRGRQQAEWICEYGNLEPSEVELGRRCVAVPARPSRYYEKGVGIDGH
jgi:hypothetical protein